MNLQNKVIKLVNVRWRDLEWFQGDLKSSTSEDKLRLENSFMKNGIIDAFKVWVEILEDGSEKMWILDGHRRKMFLNNLEASGVTIADELPAMIIDCSDRKEAAKYVLLYSVDYGHASTESLNSFIDREGLNFSHLEMEADLNTLLSNDELMGILQKNLISIDTDTEVQRTGEVEEVDVEEVPTQAVSVIGDLYEFVVDGYRYRLLCGDSTNPKDVETLMDGQRASLFATDPPYGVNYKGTNLPSNLNGSSKKWDDEYIEWDKEFDFPSMIRRFIQAAIDIAIDSHAAWYCWHASRNQSILEAIWNEFGAFVAQQIIWVKNRPVITYSHFGWGHEPCFYGWIKGNMPARHYREEKKEDDKFYSTVWNLDHPLKSGDKSIHPTMKPIEVFAIPMLMNTSVGDLCYEPFSGSGTQILAGIQLNRSVFAMELSPTFVDASVKRIKRYCDDSNREYDLLKNGESIKLKFAESFSLN